MSSSSPVSPGNSLFGAADWAKYFGDVGIEPPLPPNINEVLKSRCPFRPDELVEDTHLLTLIPATVDGKPFNLDLLKSLVESPNREAKTTFRYYSDYVQKELGWKTPDRSYWVLMMKDILPGTRNRTREDQIELMKSYKENSKKIYRLPKALEATASILMEYVRGRKGCFTDNQLGKEWTFTRCSERVMSDLWSVTIGGLGKEGLNVSCGYDVGVNHSGVAGVWRFEVTKIPEIPPALEVEAFPRVEPVTVQVVRILRYISRINWGAAFGPC